MKNSKQYRKMESLAMNVEDSIAIGLKGNMRIQS